MAMTGDCFSVKEGGKSQNNLLGTQLPTDYYFFFLRGYLQQNVIKQTEAVSIISCLLLCLEMAVQKIRETICFFFSNKSCKAFPFYQLDRIITSKTMMDFRLICSSIRLPRDPPKCEASACQNIALFRSTLCILLWYIRRKACQKSLIQINKVRLVWNESRSSYGNEKKVMLVLTFFQISMMTSSNIDQSDPSPSPSTSSCNSIQWSPSSSLNSEESTDTELPGKKLTVNLLRKHYVRCSYVTQPITQIASPFSFR